MHAILDADGAMILESRGRGRGGALLADMQRAFPSICPKFQEWMANKLEAPEWFKAALYKGFRRVTHVLYAHKKVGRRHTLAIICLGLMTVGVTQGNPLSALWFITVFNPLLEKIIAKLEKKEFLRGFADDIFVWLSSVHRIPEIIFIFLDFGKLTNIVLNPKQSRKEKLTLRLK